ncbi:MAG: hypothetical protein GX653_03835 [Clostridiales bacterium]|nr:hypothetical protein [Clostridiales bacterium]
MAASFAYTELNPSRCDRLVFFRFRVVYLSQRSAATFPSFDLAGAKKSIVYHCAQSFVQYDPERADDRAITKRKIRLSSVRFLFRSGWGDNRV